MTNIENASTVQPFNASTLAKPHRAFSPGRIGAITANTLTELTRLRVFYVLLEEPHRRQHQLQRCKAEPVAPWLHPEFHCKGQQKNTRNPSHERTKHGRQREEQCGCQPKQRSPWNTPVPLTLASIHAHALTPFDWNRLSARKHW